MKPGQDNHYTQNFFSLEENAVYFLRTSNRYEARRFCQVKFAGHTPCPAVVIVQEEGGRKFPCSRDNLFISTEMPFNGWHPDIPAEIIMGAVVSGEG